MVENFVEPFLLLSPAGHRALIEIAPSRVITGGAIHDGVIAATVKETGGTLMTRDRRAILAYEALGVSWRFVE